MYVQCYTLAQRSTLPAAALPGRTPQITVQHRSHQPAPAAPAALAPNAVGLGERLRVEGHDHDARRHTKSTLATSEREPPPTHIGTHSRVLSPPQTMPTMHDQDSHVELQNIFPDPHRMSMNHPKCAEFGTCRPSPIRRSAGHPACGRLTPDTCQAKMAWPQLPQRHLPGRRSLHAPPKRRAATL